MVKSAEEIIAAYSVNADVLISQRSRNIQKLQELHKGEITKGINTGASRFLDWTKYVVFFLESWKDSEVNNENIIKVYQQYVAELIDYINAMFGKSAVHQELELLNLDLSRQLKTANAKLRDMESKTLLGKQAGIFHMTPTKVPDLTVKEEPAEEEAVVSDDDIMAQPEPEEPEFKEVSEEMPIAEMEEEPSREMPVEEGPEPVAEVISEKPVEEASVEEVSPEEPEMPAIMPPIKINLGRVTNAFNRRMMDVNSSDFRRDKAEAAKYREIVPMLSDYSFIEHRFYKLTFISIGLTMEKLPAGIKNVCRVCKKALYDYKTETCSINCKNIKRRFDYWLQKYPMMRNPEGKLPKPSAQKARSFEL